MAGSIRVPRRQAEEDQRTQDKQKRTPRGGVHEDIFFFFETGTCYVAQDGLELEILLP
jgi:hypothetical protein